MGKLDAVNYARDNDEIVMLHVFDAEIPAFVLDVDNALTLAVCAPSPWIALVAYKIPGTSRTATAWVSIDDIRPVAPIRFTLEPVS